MGLCKSCQEWFAAGGIPGPFVHCHHGEEELYSCCLCLPNNRIMWYIVGKYPAADVAKFCPECGRKL